jgi:hypothetical protein
VTAYDDAVEATARTVQAEVTITWPGGTNPIFSTVADVQIDRVVADLPESVTQVAGTASAQAQVTLRSKNVTDALRALQLSPFSTSSWSSRLVSNYGIGAVVVIAEKILVSGSFTSTTLFTGTLIAFNMSDDGAVTLTCQDKAAAVQSTLSLPAAGGTPAGTTGIDTRLNPIAVVDLALRSAGLCITPTARATAVLSVPGVGSPLPEVGEFVSMVSADGYRVSPWGTTGSLDVSAGGVFAATTLTPTVVETWIAIEGWFLPASWPGVSQVLAQVGETSSSYEITLTLNNNGSITTTFNGGSSTTSAGAFPNDSAWHYVALGWAAGTTSTASVRVDSTTYASFSLTAAGITDTTEVTISTPFLGLQMWQDTAALIVASYNNSWTPTVPVAIETVPQKLTGVQRSSVPAWQTIQEIAAAYGDLAYFDGDGTFTWESRATWKARRFATPARTLTGDRILGGVPSWSADGMRTSVRASVMSTVTAVSTTTAPAWVAEEIYAIPANSTKSFDIALDYSVYDLGGMLNGFQSYASASWVRAVRSTAVGDPAATHVGPIGGGWFTATATGIRLTIRNNNAYAISLWTPGDGGSIGAGPYAIANGTTVRSADPTTLTVETGASITTGGDLILDDNVWRQDADYALPYVQDIAPEVALPQVMWPSFEIPVDPRLTIGDVISVQDTRYMDVAHPVQIVGISWDLPSGGMHTMTLTVRTAYPVTGWVLDVSGRSELDSTTTLVV